MNRQAIQWRAQQLLKANCLVLDTETTGLGNSDEVVEVAVVDVTGHVVFESYVRPRRAAVTAQAQGVHKISPAQLIAAPSFAAVWHTLAATLRDKTVVAYNAPFDRRMLRQTCAAWADTLPMGAHALETLRIGWACLMAGYTAHYGKRISLAGACERHRLEPGNHSAASDALAALRLLKTLAGVCVEVKEEVAA